MYLLVTAIHTALLVTQPRFWTSNSSHFFRRKMNCVLFAYYKATLDIFQKRSLKNNGRNCHCELHLPGGSQGSWIASLTVIHLRTSSSWSPATWSKRPSSKRLVVSTCIGIAPLSSRVLLLRCHTSTKQGIFQFKCSLFRKTKWQTKQYSCHTGEGKLRQKVLSNLRETEQVRMTTIDKSHF